jgi:PAS domain S-box-containing protein
MDYLRLLEINTHERAGMLKGQFLANGRVRPVAGIVLILLLTHYVVFLVLNSFCPSFAQGVDPSRPILVGQGMIMIVLACLAIYLRLHKEVLETETRLEEKNRELESEKEHRLRVEQELRQTLDGLGHRIEEQILLSTVIEQTEDNVLITDSHRTILYINPAFERSSGYKCEELKGNPLRCLRSDQHDAAYFKKMKQTLDRGENWMGIIINRGKDGTDFEIEGTISPIRDPSGTITHWVAVGRNMSRFRKLELELQRAQKLDALGTLAGGIAHDFNNILAAVMGLIEMESLEAKAGSRTSQRMNKALSACNRARDLVKQILTFSRQGEQRRKPLRMGPVIEDALRMLRATLPTTITINQDFEKAEAMILGDPTQIHQILINLCTNAAHAMHRSGGILGIGLKSVEIDEKQALETPDLQPGSYLRLTVSDTGVGIDRATRERIFEPFFTTKGPGEGAGIGLSVVHGIVKSHGGKIIVQSELGKGSTFALYFPRIESIEEYPEQRPEASPAGKERILLVDDEEILVTVTSELLSTLGYEVVSAARSSEALELFRSQSDRFHLVITDQTMPGMTGMELAAELLRIKPDISIILCSGFSDEKVRETASTIGVRTIMSKPFSLQELAATVRGVLDQRLRQFN